MSALSDQHLDASHLSGGGKRFTQICCGQYLTEINVLLVFTGKENKPKAK